MPALPREANLAGRRPSRSDRYGTACARQCHAPLDAFRQTGVPAPVLLFCSELKPLAVSIWHISEKLSNCRKLLAIDFNCV